MFTRATSSSHEPAVSPADGITVRHIHAGPFEGLTKEELPAQLCVFAREVLRAEAAQPVGHYDAVHSHYWLSGQVGALARDRWGVPLVHSMHTMAKVKNDALADGDTPEPLARVIGEEQVVEAADMLIANTDIEAKQLIELYDADPGRVEVVHPGVDLDVFRPVASAEARAGLGLPTDADVLLFAGRIQPLKAPDVLLHAVAEMLERDPGRRDRLVVPVVGGPSGSGLDKPQALADLAAELGIADVVRFVPPVSQARARALVRRGDGRRRPLLQRVVRTGRGRGAGDRDAGRRGRRRRSHDRGPRRPQRAARRQPRPPRLGRRADPGPRRPGPAGAAGGGRARAGAAVLLGRDRRPDPRGLRARRRPRSASRHDRPWRRSSATTWSTTTSSSTRRAPGCSASRSRARRSSRPPVRLDVGGHALGVHAFVCRKPDENHERVYEWLLQRNLRLYAVSFAIDRLGDIYLDARLPLGVLDARTRASSTGCSAPS